jgi:hypothetical protein
VVAVCAVVGDGVGVGWCKTIQRRSSQGLGFGDTCLHRIALFLQLSEALQDCVLVLGAVGVNGSRIYTSVVCGWWWWLVVWSRNTNDQLFLPEPLRHRWRRRRRRDVKRTGVGVHERGLIEHGAGVGPLDRIH